MKSQLSSEFYKKANTVRTKLLLYIDEELKSFKKRTAKNAKFIKQENNSDQYFIVIEVTYRNKDKKVEEDNLIQFSVRRSKEQRAKTTITNNQEKTNNIPFPVKRSIYSESTCADSSNNTPQQKKNDCFFKRTDFHHRTVQPSMKPAQAILNLKNKKRKTFHVKVVSFQNSIFSIKRKTKKSKTTKMRRKPTNGRRFLKELCYYLKKPEAGERINSCKTFYNNLKKHNSKSTKIRKVDQGCCEPIEEKKDESNIIFEEIDQRKRRLKFSFRTTKKKKDFNFIEFMNKRKNKEDNKVTRESKKKVTVK